MEILFNKGNKNILKFILSIMKGEKEIFKFKRKKED
jgi:hypothetical protein